MEVLRYLSQSNVIYMLPVGSGLLLNWWFCMHHIDNIKLYKGTILLEIMILFL